MEIRNKIIISLLSAVAIYTTLSIYADINDLIIVFRGFKWTYIPLILVLTFLNYVLRFFKWDYYLRCLKINISRRDSMAIFLSGLSMSVTPVKLGEAFKSYLLKELNGVEMSKTLPIIFAERFTDLIGLIILASIGYSVFKYGKEVLITTIFVISIIIMIIQSEKMFIKLINFNFPFISRFTETVQNLYLSTHTLFKIKNLTIVVGISVLSWFFECLALFLVIEGFGLEISLLLPVFAFSFSTIVGAVSMIPGGLGVTEGSMVGILIFSGITKTVAIASTLIIRFCTLWFGVLIGLFTLSILSIYGFKYGFKIKG